MSLIQRNKFFYFLMSLIIVKNSLCLTKTQTQQPITNPLTNNPAKKRIQPFLPENTFTMEDCEIISEEPITFSNGQKIIIPSSIPDGLISYYSFDQSQPIDDSGNGLHAVGKVKAGHAFGGQGSSAKFSGGEYIYIPHNEKFNSENFTITFWLYLLDENNDDGEDICPILYKGSENELVNGPSILLDRDTKKLKIKFDTNSNKVLELNSLSRITPKKWYHISLILSKNKNSLELILNGIPDSSLDFGSKIVKFNKEPFYIGNTPDHLQDCHMKYYIDELRFYNKELELDYIQAEASIILGGIEPYYFRIGCLDCTLDEAEKSCVEGYNLCTSIEMYTGGYQLARVHGLLSYNTIIWVHQTLEEKEKYIGKIGLGMCCSIIK